MRQLAAPNLVFTTDMLTPSLGSKCVPPMMAVLRMLELTGLNLSLAPSQQSDGFVDTAETCTNVLQVASPPRAGYHTVGRGLDFKDTNLLQAWLQSFLAL